MAIAEGDSRRAARRRTIELTPEPSGTLVTLWQDNNTTEEARSHSEQNWKMMLDGLKKVVES